MSGLIAETEEEAHEEDDTEVNVRAEQRDEVKADWEQFGLMKEGWRALLRLAVLNRHLRSKIGQF